MDLSISASEPPSPFAALQVITRHKTRERISKQKSKILFFVFSGLLLPNLFSSKNNERVNLFFFFKQSLEPENEKKEGNSGERGVLPVGQYCREREYIEEAVFVICLI